MSERTKYLVILDGIHQGSRKGNGVVNNLRMSMKMPDLVGSGDDLMFAFDDESTQQRAANALRKLGHNPQTIEQPY